MKEQKIANYLKTGILLFGVSVLLWNCEKEIDFNPPQMEENNISNKSFIQFLGNPKFTLAIKELERSKYKGKSENNLYDFTIDSTRIREIKKNKTATYTFFVKRKQNDASYFENLVVKVDSLNKTEALLLKYEPSETVKYHNEHNSLSFIGKVTAIPLNVKKIDFLSKERVCIEVTTTYCTKKGTGESGTEYDRIHIANSDCGDSRYFLTITRDVCDVYSDGGGFTWDYSGFGDYSDGNDGNQGGTGGDYGDGNFDISPINYPCGDAVHNCDVFARGLASRLGLGSSDLLGLSETNLKKIEEILDLEDNLSAVIDSPNFNSLNDTWLKAMRELAKLVEYTKNFSKDVYDKLTEQLDNKLKTTLNSVAKQLYTFSPSTMSEYKKEEQFLYNGKHGVAILLDEFANGLGDDERSFSSDFDITKQMIAGNVQNDIKADFFKQLGSKTFSQFISNINNELDGGYAFSPGHTGVVDSFNKHVNANWVQFFVGGTRAKYYPSSDPGWIIVELTNETSRNSLLLHVGANYDRNGTGINRSLSTIKQIFRFKLKIQ